MAGTIISDRIEDNTGTSLPTSTVVTGCVKARVLYNLIAQTVTESYNISSVTYTSTGVFTINFTNAMANANYIVAGSTNSVSGTKYSGWCGPRFENSLTTTSATIETFCITEPGTVPGPSNAVLTSVVIIGQG